MKKNLFVVALLSFLFVFSACDKNVLIPSNEKDILTFNSVEDIDNEIIKLVDMSFDELVEYEKQKGYKSYGRECEEVYQSLNFDSFKTKEDIARFVDRNSDYLEIITDQYGDLYLETKLSNNKYRYILNKDKMYILNDSVRKVFNEGEISTKIENREKLSRIREFDDKNNIISSEFCFHPTKTISSSMEIVDESSSKSPSSNCGRYAIDRETNNRDRTKIEIKLVESHIGGQYRIYHDGIIRPYKRFLGVWCRCRRTISFQWKYTAYANIYGHNFTAGENRSGKKKAYKVESYKQLFFMSDEIIFDWDWYYLKYDCWGDTPSTDKAYVECY